MKTMKKKIYFLLPDLSAGGAERVTITIARLLCKEGFDVEFVNLGFRNGEMVSWIEPEFKMTCLNCSRVLYAIPQLVRFMNSHPNSVFFSSREHVSIVGMIASKITKTPFVVRVPNMPKNKLVKGLSGLKMMIIKTINQIVLKYAKIIIAQNKEMREQLLDYYHLPENKVVAINNPVDAEFIRKSADGSANPYNLSEVNFLNVCNVAYSKGIDVLEKAWGKVKAAIPNAHMYIVGRNNSEYARPIVENACNQTDFTFCGFKSNPYPFIKHCDVFVLPSRMEGFPNVVLEAMSLNRPVASTTCVSVIKDIIKEGVNGFYCDIEDPDALADCMIKAASLKNIENKYSLFDKAQLMQCFM